MRYLLYVFVCASLVVSLNSAIAADSTYSIPADKINIQKVYYGTASGFEKAGKVDFTSVIKATPEYTEIKQKRIARGTGAYWILMSEATQRAARAISDVGHETGYDFIAAQAYMGGLEPTIPSEDITPLIIDRVKDDGKSDGLKDKKEDGNNKEDGKSKDEKDEKDGKAKKQ